MVEAMRCQTAVPLRRYRDFVERVDPDQALIRATSNPASPPMGLPPARFGSTSILETL
jgi:hypothetical protein